MVALAVGLTMAVMAVAAMVVVIESALTRGHAHWTQGLGGGATLGEQS